MAEPLAVWLYGSRVGRLEQRRSGLRFTYAAEALDRFELNTPVLSVSLPVGSRPFPDRVARPFFEGVLPEGEQRRMLAYDLEVAEADAFGLLRELGRDCAGAVVVQSEDAGPPPSPPTEALAEPIADEELARRLDQLGTDPLGVDEEVRLSLPGLQRKLVLTRLGDGRWAKPVRGAPSTHLLKPAGRWPSQVRNEAFCLALARHLGLETAAAEVGDVAGREVLVVERFDRRRDGAVIERTHQEDCCQALGLLPRHKYEDSGGPSLRRIAEVLRRWRAPLGDLGRLLGAVTLSVVVGNADLHSKNLGILHDLDGGVRLAPVYDVMSTRAYEEVSRTAGTFVNGRREVDAIGPEDLVAEALAWGVGREEAETVVGGLLARAPAALEAAAAEVGVPPPGLAELVSERIARLG